MKLCGRVNWCKIGWLVVVFNLLFCFDAAWSQNLPPVLNTGIPNQHAVVGSTFNFTIPSTAFKDANNDKLTYSAKNLPSWLSFINGKTITGTPGSEGSTTVTIIATDGIASDSTTFTIVVHPAIGTYAAFTMNTAIGCGSKTIQFINMSNNADLFDWDLGNGNHSALPNPIAIYTEGTYTVTLTINNDPRYTYSDVVTIYKNPAPLIDQSTIKSECEPYSVTLKSNGDAGVYYHWYSEEFPDPINRYTIPGSLNLTNLPNGTYNVSLEVTDEHGCSGLKPYTSLFKVYDKPTASFTYNKTDKCKASVTNFTNTSTITDTTITGHSWTVDGIQVGTTKDLSYDFTSKPGSYIVSLTETSGHTCVSDTYTDTIVFNANNHADFSFSPAQACKGTPITFTPIVSPGISSYDWSFEGTHVSTSNPVWNFSNAGQNQIQLNASFSDGCLINVSKQVPIDEITPDFSPTISGVCLDNFTLNLSDKSTSAIGATIISVKWSWDILGDGSFQPIFPPKMGLKAGIYRIKLEVSDATGCSASVIKDITLSNSTLSFTASGATSGCAGSGTTNFLANFQSTYDHANTYSWNFGDGNFGNGATTSHTYSTGNFNVTLEVKTTNNCTYDTTIINAVQFANPPTINSVDITQADNCLNTPIELDVDYTAGTDQLIFTATPPASGITETIDGVSGTNYTYSHLFEDIGTYSIGVVAVDNGCPSTAYNVTGIQINGPKAGFSTANSFCNVRDVLFTNGTITNGVTPTYLWNFGDGNTSTEFSPTHTYGVAGNYMVTLTATDPVSGCNDNYTKTITIFSFSNTADIISATNTIGCAPLTVLFTADVKGSLSSNYGNYNLEWDFTTDNVIDSITSLDTIRHKYTNPGIYSARLHITGNGCDFTTDFNSINVLGPKVDFSVSSPVCSGSPVAFTNHSTQPAGGIADSVIWDFGDGNIQNAVSPGNATNTYNSPDSIYTVLLRVTDSNSCSDTLSKTIKIEPFTAGFSINNSVICIGDYVTFTNSSTGSGLTYNLIFGDGMTSSNPAVSHKYNLAGDYTPILEVFTTDGCVKKDSLRIHVVNVSAQFNALTTEIGCAPADVSFTPEAADADVTSYLWSFGDGITSEERIPTHRYYTPGPYTVSLTIAFTSGCDSTVTKADYITVDGAKGELNYTGQPTCAPNQVQFNLANLWNVDKIQWDFGNGAGEKDSIAQGTSNYSTTYTYVNVGYTKPSVMLTSNKCKTSYAYEKNSTNLIKDPVRIYTSVPPKPAFTLNYTDICQGVPIHFTDASDTLDNLYPASHWEWNFGDIGGRSDTTQNPSHAYKQVGSIAPQLIISNQLGCSDSTTGHLTIRERKNIHDTIDSPDKDNYLVCPGSPVNFRGSASSSNGSIVSWKWDFGDGDSASAQPTSHTYSKSLRGRHLDVLLVATDDKLCSDSTFRTVAINSLQARLGYSPQPVFRGKSVGFRDSSSFTPGYPVNSWSWTFTGGNPGTSTDQNPQNIVYDYIITYPVALEVSDTSGCTADTTVSLPVRNNPPVIKSFAIWALINTPYQFNQEEFESNFDPEDPGQSLSEIMIVGQPAHGTLKLNNVPITTYPQTITYADISNLSYTSTSVGHDAFSWRASDGTDYSNVASVNIQVIPIPPPPTLSDLVFIIREDSVLSFNLNLFKNHFSNYPSFPGFKLDTLEIVTIPTSLQGTLTYNTYPVSANQKFTGTEIDNGIFTVAPIPGYDGSISFYWNGFDSLKWGSPARVIINYRNSIPVLKNIERDSLKEDAVQTILKGEFRKNYSDSDRYDTATTFYLYIPSGLQSNFEINNKPVITGVNSISFDQLVSVTFTPNKGSDSTIQVQWGASDGQDEGNAYIRFTYVNTPPVARDVNISGFEDSTLFFTSPAVKLAFSKGFYDVDINDSPGKIRITSLPANGRLTLFADNPVDTGNEYYYTAPAPLISSLRYRSNTDWNGLDSFKFKVSDGTDWSANEATVWITIAPVNDPPRPVNDLDSILEDHVLTGFNVMKNDTDIDDLKSNLRVTIANSGTAGQHGKITLDSIGNLKYEPDLNFNGTVQFTYNLCDTSKACATATVTIVIIPVNDPPVAYPDFNSLLATTDSIVSDKFTNLLANDSDVDIGDTIHVIAVKTYPDKLTGGTFGWLVWQSNGNYTYYNNHKATDSLFSGEIVTDVFPYTISDIAGAKAYNSLTIKITGVNANPVAKNDTLRMKEHDHSGSLKAGKGGLLDSVTDVNGDKLTVIKVNDSTQKIDTTQYGILTWDASGNVHFVINDSVVAHLQVGDTVTEKFSYVAADPYGGTATAQLVIMIVGQNNNPVAVNDSVTITEDTPSVSGAGSTSLIFNDRDIEGDPIFIRLVNGKSDSVAIGLNGYGELHWHSNGAYTDSIYHALTDTLAQGEIATDRFLYTLSDNYGGTDTASFIVVIQGLNDPPVARPDSNATTDIFPIVATLADTTYVLHNDYDVDSHSRIKLTSVNESANPVTQGKFGMLSWDTTGSYTYRPDSSLISLRAREQRTDSFTYTIEDEYHASDSTLLQLTIVGINNAPTARNDTLPIFGNVISAGLYPPEKGLLLNDSDPDSIPYRDTLSVIMMAGSTMTNTKVTYGTLTWDSTGKVEYFPTQRFLHRLGPEQAVTELISYTISDGGGKRASAKLVVKIIGANDSVFAHDDYGKVWEDSLGRFYVVANDSDVDNDGKGNFDYSSLSIVDHFGPYHGKASRNSVTGEIYYKPDKDFYGKDSLKYQICDTGEPVYCSEAWLHIDVLPVNDPPEATPWVLKTPMNKPVSFDALDKNHVKDIDDGIDSTSTNVSGVKNVKLVGHIITYTPDLAFTGKVEFTYSVKDHSKATAYVLVTVIVGDTLLDFQAQNDTVSTLEDTPVDINVLANDTLRSLFPDPRTVEIKVFPKNGVATFDLVKKKIRYQPDNSFNGSDSLEYIVSTGLDNWSSAWVSIKVIPFNNPFYAKNDWAETNVNTAISINVLTNDIDPDNRIDSLAVCSPANNGTATIAGAGTITYTPAPDFTGIDTFAYRVCDTNLQTPGCDSALVFVLVKPQQMIFVAGNDNYTTDENKPKVLINPSPFYNDKNLIHSEIPVDSSTFTVISGPLHGSDTFKNDVVTYTPETDYFGPDWMEYLVADEAGNRGMAEINIWVNEVNIPPVAVNDTVIVTKNEFKRLYVLENDWDPDGTLNISTLAIVSGKGPKNGELQIDRNTGTILYKPNINTGNDQFTYRICDNKGECSEATVMITIALETNIFIYASTLEDILVSVDIASKMADYNLTFTLLDQNIIKEKEQPDLGKYTFTNNNKELTYTPLPNLNGDDTIHLSVWSEDHSQFAYLWIYIHIIPVNDAPVAVDDTLHWINAPGPKVITFDSLLVNDYDVDNDSIRFTKQFLKYGPIKKGYPGLTVAVDSIKHTITITADTILWCNTWFTYEITDGILSDTAKVDIWPDLNGIVANHDWEALNENTSKKMDVLANDIFKDNQRCTIDSVAILTPSNHGQATITADHFVDYVPNRHYFGPDSLEYKITDIWGQSSSAWVTIQVVEKNSPPVAVDDTVSDLGTAVNITLLNKYWDPDATIPPVDPNARIDSARTHLASGSYPLYGTVVFDTTTFNFIYTPEVKSCVDSFRYTVFDNEGDSATATVFINFSQAPIFAITDTVKTYPGIPVDVEPLLNDMGYFIPEINSHTYPLKGDISITNNVVTYSPNPDFMDHDSMMYTIVSPCGKESNAYIVFIIKKLRVPEIITPNGDGKNDWLIIDGIDYFPDNFLQIFNRYGHVVYEKKGYNKDSKWAGYSNRGSLGGDKPLPAGTYYYTLIYNDGRNRQAGFIYIFW